MVERVETFQIETARQRRGMPSRQAACCGCFPRRFEHILLCFAFVFVSYLMRVVLSVTLVGRVGIGSDLGWTSVQNGLILSGFFWGYLLGNFPGGVLSSRFGGRPVLLGSMVAQIILILLSPMAARAGVYYFFFVRFFLGVVQGPLYPVCQTLLSRWLKAEERSRGNSMFDSGSYLSTAVSLGFGTSTMNSLGSWTAMYYGCGFIGALFCAVAFFRVESFPPTAQATGEEYATLVAETLDLDDEPARVPDRTAENADNSLAKGEFPWRKILLRKSIIAAIVGPTSINWSIYMFLTYLPIYGEQQLDFDMSAGNSAGALFVFPYVASWLVGLANSFFADYLVKSKILSITNVRKLMQTLASSILTVSLFQLGNSGISQVPVLLCLSIVAGGGITASASTAIPMDMSKKYAGFIKGVANSAGTLGGALNPIIVGFLLQSGGCPSEDLLGTNKTLALKKAHTVECKGAWTTAFDIAACITVVGGVTFVFLASAEPIELGEDVYNSALGDTAELNDGAEDDSTLVAEEEESLRNQLLPREQGSIK